MFKEQTIFVIINHFVTVRMYARMYLYMSLIDVLA